MTLINLITRVDAICKKYDKYDVDKQRDVNAVPNDDAFARLYADVQAEIDAALQKAEAAAATAENRAATVAMNAEIRRTKARLYEQLPKLQRLAFKKVKKVSKEELEARTDLVSALKDRIEAIPDGNGIPTQSGGNSSSTRTGIKFDALSGKSFDRAYYQQTEESDRFRQEFEMRRMKQDQGLDVIAEGLDTLKHMAGDLDEELNKQAPLMDEIEEKVDTAATDIKNTNRKLKNTVLQLRSSRNFCLDIFLLCIILGIASFLYNVLR